VTEDAGAGDRVHEKGWRALETCAIIIASEALASCEGSFGRTLGGNKWGNFYFSRMLAHLGTVIPSLHLKEHFHLQPKGFFQP
jgi:hypothetical protein